MIAADHPNLQKAPCTECSKECFNICRIGNKLVCVGCFSDNLEVNEAIREYRTMQRRKVAS